MRKVNAGTTDGVKSSGRMEEHGMKHEGMQRGQTRDAEGHRTDLSLYGLLRDDA